MQKERSPAGLIFSNLRVYKLGNFESKFMEPQNSAAADRIRAFDQTLDSTQNDFLPNISREAAEHFVPKRQMPYWINSNINRKF